MEFRDIFDFYDSIKYSHFEATYEHWCAKGDRQRKDLFSDGTLLLIGLIWSLLESYSLLLLEEPELSLNTGIIKKLPSLMTTVLRNKKRKSQVMISTHSAELLSDVGICGEEVIILIPKPEGTVVEDYLSEVVVRRIIEKSGRLYDISSIHGQNGCSYIDKNINGFNNAAKGFPYLILLPVINPRI